MFILHSAISCLPLKYFSAYPQIFFVSICLYLWALLLAIIFYIIYLAPFFYTVYFF